MLSGLPSWIDLLVFLGGCLGMGVLLRRWQPAVSRRAVAAYTAVVLVLCGLPLATDLGQLPTDIAYQWRPWRSSAEGPVDPHNPLLADPILQMLPFHDLVRSRLLALQAPLWTSELGTGQPLAGNAQSAPFSLLHLPTLPLPTARGLTVSAAWSLLLGLLLAHALLAELGASPAGRALGAVGYGLSVFVTGWLYYPLTATAVWLPGVLLGVVAVARRERGGWAGLVACATGMALAGHPETLFHGALAAVAVASWTLTRLSAGGRGRAVVGLATAALASFALASPALLPVLDALPASERSALLERRPDAASPPPFRAASLVPAVDPLAFGAPHTHDYRGTSNWLEYCSHYAGILPLALAVAGAIVLRGRAAAIVLGGLVALAAAVHFPPFHDALRLLPLVGGGAHARLRLLWCLAVAVAAGLSLQPLLDRRAGRLASGVACLLALGALVAFPPGSPSPWARGWWWAAVAGLVVFSGVLAVPKLRPRAATVAVGVTVSELLLLALPVYPLVPPDLQLEPTPLLDRLSRLTRTSPRPVRVIAEGWDLLPNLGALYGLWDPRGNDPMRPARPRRLLAQRIGRVYRSTHVIQHGDRWDPVIHRFLGIRWVVTPRGRHLPPPWREAFAEADSRVWENPQALALFFVPAQVRTLADEAAARRFAVHATTLDRQAVLTGAGLADGPWVAQQGEVERLRARPNGFRLGVSSPAGMVVASSVSRARGWRVEVDGSLRSTFTSDWAFLAFRVPPGRHTVVITYAPAGWWGGLLLAAAAVLGILLTALARRLWTRGGPALERLGTGPGSGQSTSRRAASQTAESTPRRRG